MGQSKLKDYSKYVPCFKASRRKHESGWRMFTVGYVPFDSDTPDEDFIEWGTFPDVIHIWEEYFSMGVPDLNFDITPKGLIRIRAMRKGMKVRWNFLASSDLMLEPGDPVEHIKELLERNK